MFGRKAAVTEPNSESGGQKPVAQPQVSSVVADGRASAQPGKCASPLRNGQSQPSVEMGKMAHASHNKDKDKKTAGMKHSSVQPSIGADFLTSSLSNLATHHSASSASAEAIKTDDEMSIHSSLNGIPGSPSPQEPKNKMDARLVNPLVSKNSYLSKLSKSESLKLQKKHYRYEKKRAANELLSTLKDPSVIIIADWLKVRGSLKSWTKLWCVLKPGLLILNKSMKLKSSHWVGTVLLNTCELIERPSKKDGFCFKLFHPLDQSIWATKGPKGENIGALVQPLPYSYLIFRAPSEAAGKCWMDALELALRCSGLLMRTMTSCNKDLQMAAQEGATFQSSFRQQMDESDCERHFKGCGLEDDLRTDKEDRDDDRSDSESEEDEDVVAISDDDVEPIETPYIENLVEELGQQGDASQTEEVADENKSLIWSLVKQVRPGMDLSKVVLPTFILEPRSFLDKLSDYYYHADLLSEAVLEDDAFTRMKLLVRWYLSGFYKKPRGLKKPYNPILGETFRCYWKHPKTGSRTFYIAEQISHHPPISAIYITNRQDGFVISGSILAKSKFYGNSLSAILDGVARLVFLKRGEDYQITMPYAHCKGILIGTLTMELGGPVTIECEKTGYRADLEFKLKPFLGSGEASNKIAGKIKLGAETLAVIDGHWDQEIYITDRRTGETSLFWNPSPDVKSKRLKRYTVPLDAQGEFESERLWHAVSNAIIRGDQTAATNEKFLLEEAQRKAAKERKAKMEEFIPRLFDRNSITGDWMYKYSDLRPWDALNDVVQYEHDFVVQTKTRHQTPIVHTTSITSVEEKVRGHSRQSSRDLARMARINRASVQQMRSMKTRRRESSTPEGDAHAEDSDSSTSEDNRHRLLNQNILQESLEPLVRLQEQTSERLRQINDELRCVQASLRQRRDDRATGQHDLVTIVAMILLQIVLFWWFK